MTADKVVSNVCAVWARCALSARTPVSRLAHTHRGGDHTHGHRGVTVVVRPPSPSAPREAPLAAALFDVGAGGGPPNALYARLEEGLTGAGFAVATVRLPLGPATVPPPGSWKEAMDDLVSDLHAALHAAGLYGAPIAIAPGSAAVLLQKYMESWPLASLIALAPLPPAPGPTIARWPAAARADLPTAALLRFPRASYAAALLRSPSGVVRLEPSPVPILVGAPEAGGGGQWLHEAEVRATLRLHGLEEGEVLRLGGDGALRALWGLGGEEGGRRAEEEFADRLVAWVDRRW